jgi:hypothetical protein
VSPGFDKEPVSFGFDKEPVSLLLVGEDLPFAIENRLKDMSATDSSCAI